MPRAKPKNQETTEIKPVIEELAKKYSLVPASEIPDPSLPTFADRERDEKPFEVVPYPDEPLPPLQRAENKTARPFVGRVASGRGVKVTADDTSYAIESDHPLTAGQIALAQRNGFDDYSEGQDGRIMVADKGEMRRVGGDINWTARTVTGPESGRSR